LGRVPIKTARTIKTHVENLAAAAFGKHSPDPETSAWVGGLDSVMYDKLAAVGLVVPREAATITTVVGFLTEYVVRRVDVKPATREVWRIIEANLIECFGEHRDLKTIDEPAAEDFKLFLQNKKLSATTIAKRLQFARQFFKAAVKRKLIAGNPFADVAGKAVPKTDRQRFVTREETARLLAACPNVDWRAIVALSRFGGLRCPSEVLSLQWQWIDWEHGRMRVYSPKTEHHEGKAHRDVPLFPELRAILEEAWDLAPEGAVYVVGNDAYRKAADTATGWRNCNLRTQFGRILRRRASSRGPACSTLCGRPGKRSWRQTTPFTSPQHGWGTLLESP
jgi:integrase